MTWSNIGRNREIIKTINLRQKSTYLTENKDKENRIY
jgi:hypothetical protein